MSKGHPVCRTLCESHFPDLQQVRDGGAFGLYRPLWQLKKSLTCLLPREPFSNVAPAIWAYLLATERASGTLTDPFLRSLSFPIFQVAPK